ncbi:MAG: hypothetical protein U0Y68_14650 [Blastocatellia bacterium]
MEFGQGIIFTCDGDDCAGCNAATDSDRDGRQQRRSGGGCPVQRQWQQFNGLYTAPPVAPASPVITTASAANSERSATAAITVSGSAIPPTVAVSISPTSAAMLTGATQHSQRRSQAMRILL